MIKRRITSVLALTLIALGTLVPMAEATPATPSASDTKLTSHTGNCYDAIGTNPRHVGVSTYVPGGSMWGVESNIEIDTTNIEYFDYCGDGGGQDGAHVWVSLEPAPGTTHYNNTNAIMQIGLTHCWALASDACTWADQYSPRFFWASGGCNGYTPTPQDIREAELNTDYVFKINRVVSNGQTYYRMYINGNLEVNLLPSNDSIDCWIGSAKETGWYGETWDAGDVLGRSNGVGTQFRDMQWRSSADSTFSDFTDAEACDRLGPSNSHHPLECDGFNGSSGLGDSMNVWSSGW